MENITRREFLKISSFAAASLGATSFLPSCAAGNRATAAKTKCPNIIFILADDLGYGDIGCFGLCLVFE